MYTNLLRKYRLVSYISREQYLFLPFYCKSHWGIHFVFWPQTRINLYNWNLSFTEQHMKHDVLSYWIPFGLEKVINTPWTKFIPHDGYYPLGGYFVDLHRSMNERIRTRKRKIICRRKLEWIFLWFLFLPKWTLPKTRNVILVVHLGGDSWKQSNTVENMIEENGKLMKAVSWAGYF